MVILLIYWILRSKKLSKFPRLDTLKLRSEQISTNKVPLVLTFHLFNYKVRDIITRNFGILKNDSETSSIFTDNPLISFRHNKNIRDCLVHSALKQNSSLQASELNFHIWNANSRSFARVKSEPKMAAHGGKFWTSVSVLLVVLYVTSSRLQDFNLQFLFGSTSKTFTTMEKVHRRIITGAILHTRVFKRIYYSCVA